MICYRSVSLGNMVKKQLEPAYASIYFNIATVIVESLLPYTLLGIIFVITLGIGSPIGTSIQSVYLMFMVSSSLYRLSVTSFMYDADLFG